MEIQVMCVNANDKVAQDDESDGLYTCDGETWDECLDELSNQHIPKGTVRIEIDLVPDDE